MTVGRYRFGLFWKSKINLSTKINFYVIEKDKIVLCQSMIEVCQLIFHVDLEFRIQRHQPQNNGSQINRSSWQFNSTFVTQRRLNYDICVGASQTGGQEPHTAPVSCPMSNHICFCIFMTHICRPIQVVVQGLPHLLVQPGGAIDHHH